MAKAGGDNLIAMLGGGLLAVITDVAWNSLHLPGYNVQVGTGAAATGNAIPITLGDAIQMGVTAAAGTVSFGVGGISRVQPLLWGALLTQFATKYLFPTFGLGRYILFDLDSEGRVVPVLQLPI